MHRHHGVGQIMGVEVKQIGGDENEYYKIDTHASTMWVPVEQLETDAENFRALSTEEEVEEALAVLENSPRKLGKHINQRKSFIKKARSKNSLTAIARMIRDLWARRKIKKGLSNTETQALNHFTNSFVAEVSVAMDIEKEDAQKKMESILEESITEHLENNET